MYVGNFSMPMAGEPMPAEQIRKSDSSIWSNGVTLILFSPFASIELRRRSAPTYGFPPPPDPNTALPTASGSMSSRPKSIILGAVSGGVKPIGSRFYV